MPVDVDTLKFQNAIPGQSLTSDPEAPGPYEKPPKHTDKDKAIGELFDRLTNPEIMKRVVGLMRDGTPVEDLTKQIMFGGFMKGQYNPDLMLGLVEPTAYMLLFLADQAGINPVLYNGEEGEDTVDFSDVNVKKRMAAEVSKRVPAGLMSKAIGK